MFLPSYATETEPQWMQNEFGQLVPRTTGSENESLLFVKDSKKDNRASLAIGGSAQRLPFKAKDPNVNFGAEYEKPAENDWFNPHGFVQSAVVAASAKRSEVATLQFPRKSKPEVQPAFRVFDETADAVGSGSVKASNHSKPPQARQLHPRLDSIMSMAANMRLGNEERTPAEKPPPTDNDAEILLLMLERLSTVLDVSEQHKFSYSSCQVVKPVSRGAPIKWITRYVDYTSKYGLGFLMNDGRCDRVCRLNDRCYCAQCPNEPLQLFCSPRQLGRVLQ
jgi:hypothetical protein